MTRQKASGRPYNMNITIKEHVITKTSLVKYFNTQETEYYIHPNHRAEPDL